MTDENPKAIKKRIPSYHAYVEAEVDIDPDDLREAGWHFEDECKEGTELNAALPILPNEDVRALLAAVASLHRQAHPSASRGVRLCREEPCRSLSLDQLAQVPE